MPDISANRFATYMAIAFVAGAGILALIFASLRTSTLSTNDDQPPIIVRDGSVIFDGGDAKNPNKGRDNWTPIDSANQKWRAMKAGGNAHHVNSFTVYIAGVLDPQNCPNTTMAGDAVDVDYSTTTTTLHFHVLHTDDGTGQGGNPHHSPEVDAVEAPGLTANATGSTVPYLLAGTPHDGWISRVAALGLNQEVRSTCTIMTAPSDDNYRALVRVSIVPERY